METGHNTRKKSVPRTIFDTKKFKISASLNQPMEIYFARGFIKMPIIPKANERYKNKSFLVKMYKSKNPVVKTKLVSNDLYLSMLVF